MSLSILMGWVVQGEREAALRYLKQVCFALALLLILYGVIQLLNFLLDLANIYVGYYLWLSFHVLAAFVIIFIGFRVYSIAKTIKMTHLTVVVGGFRPHLFVLLLSCLALLPVILYPLPASSFIYPQPLRSYFIHNPISFSYKLNYGWNFQEGGFVWMITTHIYPTMPYRILTDVINVYNGWIVVPYEIDGSGAILQAVGPATAKIQLGFIANGDYVLKIVMSDAVDIFLIRKTNNKFWVEQIKAIKGQVVQKSEFERRLDGFKVEFIGFPNIDNETKTFVLEKIQEIGGEIVDTESYFEGWSVWWLFYYSGEYSSLRQIIREVATKKPNYMIGIYSNTGWRTMTWVPESYQ